MSDRKALIRLASTLPKGSEERKAILTGLQKMAARVPKVLYHGTSLQRFRKMQQTGMRTNLIYLSAEKEGTTYYRQQAWEEDMDFDELPDNAPVILVFDTRTLMAQGTLMPDWDDIGDAWRRGDFPTPPEDTSWEESLEWGDSVSYKGPLEKALVNVEILR